MNGYYFMAAFTFLVYTIPGAYVLLMSPRPFDAGWWVMFFWGGLATAFGVWSVSLGNRQRRGEARMRKLVERVTREDAR